MGLGIAELMLDLEETFEIRIPDAQAQKCETVGALVEMVYSKTRHSKDQPCPSQQGFYVVRRCLVQSVGCSRDAVRPETPLKELINKGDRRSACDVIREELVPGERNDFGLRRPLWISLLVFFVLPAVVLFYENGIIHGWWKLALAISIAVIGAILTRPLKQHFPWRCWKVKHLIRYVNTLDDQVWSRKELQSTIREIVAERACVDPESVKLDSHLIKDLAMG